MSKTKMPISVEENTRTSRSRHKEASVVPQLPPLSINAMTPVQLQEFVPALMKVVMGDYSSTRSSGLVHRPHWWPPDVPLWSGAGERSKEGAFTEAMKKVVRNCYHHLGQGALLSAGKLNDWRTLVGRVQTRKQALASGDAGSVPDSLGEKCIVVPQGRRILNRFETSTELSKSGKKPFVEIYVCFFCNKEFSAKEDMRMHQLGCTKRPQELQSLDTPPPATKRNRPQIKPLTPVPAEKSPSSSPSMEQFLHQFHLIPVSKAKRLRASTRRSTEVDCSKIDFSEPETPISPTTPKTPKLLISQLSRDDSGHCKRRLSYRLQEDQSDSESVVSGSSEDTDDKQAPTRTKSLLSIDVSSLLGQRLQKHLKSDTSICVVTNAEAYCKTPVKNHFLEKLRKKENTFPITYKPRKKTKKRPHVHLYSFTRRQRINHYRRLRTGLNKRSRILARSIPKCRVVLGRLTKQSLKYWESRQEREQNKMPCIFPEGPTFLSEDIDKMLGLRKKNRAPKPERSLSLANVVSEDTNAEVLQQKVAVYRSLLSDLSSSKEQSLISISPNKAAKLSMLQDNKENAKLKERFPQLNSLLQTGSSNNSTIPGEPLTPSSSTSSSPDSSQLSKRSLCQPLKIEIPPQASLRKHSFRRSLSACSSHGDVPRECMSPDDSVSIVTVSSDEDSFNALCCAGCRERQKCKCSPVKADLNANVNMESKVASRLRNIQGQFLSKAKIEELLMPEKKSKDIRSAFDQDEKKLQQPGKKNKDISSISVDKKKTHSVTEDKKKTKEHSIPEDKKKTKEHSVPKDKKMKELSVVEDKKRTKELSLHEDKKKRELSVVEDKTKTRGQSVQEDKMKTKEHSIPEKRKVKENSIPEDKRKMKERSAVEDKKRTKEHSDPQQKKTKEHPDKKKTKLSLPEDKKKARDLFVPQDKKPIKEPSVPEGKKKTKEVSVPEDKKKAKEVSLYEDKKKTKVPVPQDKKKTKISVSEDKKKTQEPSGDKRKKKELTVQEDKNKLKHSVPENKTKDLTTEDKKSKDNKSVAEDKKTKECSALSENKKSKDVKMFASCTSQYGLRRQASAPAGLEKTLLHSQSPVKTSDSPVKRPFKLGLRSHNSTPTNSPVRGLKRQASCSPTKSAMPSPKKSRFDLMPRKQSNSVLI